MEELHKSCDQCGKKKRKCPGGKPCSRCVHSTETCTYSKRRPRTPSSEVAALRLRRAQACSLLQQHVKSSLKRYRWSASPATGLVGLQENAFLCDFFGSAGFMPLASQSGIRETMIKIMMSPHLQQQQPGVKDGYYGVEKTLDPSLLGGGCGFGPAVVGRHLPVDPSSCTFWCTVAMGALVKGRPIESVATYVRLAREAIASFSGPATPEMAKAWASLAYLYGFMDEQEEFHGYLALSDSFLRGTGANDAIPVGFAEMIQTGETIKLVAGEVGPEEREALLAKELSRPKLGNFAGEGEICRCVWQSARIFEQAIGAGIFAPTPSAFGDEGDASAHQPDKVDDDSPGRDGVTYDRSLGIHPVLATVRTADLRPDCMTLAKVDVVADLLQFRLLENVAEIPSIKDGIGGLIINDHLLFEKVTKGDAPGALERAGRCIDVFERYPGLCRFKLGAHKAHIMIGILVAMDSPPSRKLFAKLRAAYNFTRPERVQQIPPLEEWRGVSAFCRAKTCRSSETCGKMAFAPPPARVAVIGQDSDRGTGSDNDLQDLNESSLSRQTAVESPFEDVQAFSEVGQTIPAELELIGPDQDSSSGSDTGVKADSESFSGLVVQGAEALLLSTCALADESEKEAVGAEDWLEVTQAMMDISELDAAFV